MRGQAVWDTPQPDKARLPSGHLTFSDLPLLDALWMPVWLFDSERTRMVWANQAALELWSAASQQEFLERDFSDMSDAARTRLASLLQQLTAGNQVIDQWTFYPKGQPVTTRVRRTGMILPDGRLGMLHEAQVIDQPVDPATLRGVEALNQTYVKISLFSRDGLPLMRNPAAERTFGPVGLDGDRDRLAAHFVHEEDRCDLLAALDRGEVFRRFVEVSTNSGLGWHRFDARITIDPVSGEPMVLVNERNVTEHVRAEQAMMTSARRLARMVEHLPAGAAYVEGETIFLNRAAEEICGYTRDEIPTLDVWFKAAYPNNHESIRDRYCAARNAGTPVSVELQIRRKDGALRWLLFSAYFADYGEVWLIQDVTDHRAATEALRRERAMLQSLIESIPDIVFFKDTSGTYLNGNHAALEYAGGAAENALGLRDSDLFDAETAERRRRGDQVAMEQGSTRSEEWSVYPDGRKVLLETVKAPCRDANGTVLGVVGIARDITERRRAEDQLRQERTLLQGLIDAIPDAILFKEPNGQMRKVNKAFAAWFGLAPENLSGLSGDDIWPPQLAEDVRRQDTLVLTENQALRKEMTIPRATGDTVDVEMIKVPIYDDDGDLLGLVGIGRDITKRKQIEAELRRSEAEKGHMAHHDALTGLPNRRLFFDRLDLAMARAQRCGHSVALLFIDLDGFKKVNDTHGHDCGDHVLRIAAARIVDCLRKSDAVARIGGDEFTVTLEDVALASDASRVADKIIDAVSVPIPVHGRTAVIGASIGIALYPSDGQDAHALLNAADAAMYRAKQAGRGKRVFHKSAPDTAPVPGVGG
ncbi:PAS domain S-box protein [Azospirillum canadense]|uniref:PAS domain S-box protein n=1 Tax=Azospirillum canadense TaxID=403962 RepID=UPI002227D5A9|nr:PAS domain S-box protein [Azospirillum canadense]MCW2239038.1 diguanylate cyclase (GGDEF)-like protein/PAS domain S-box-containing protein [Azospirillum canadense]